jgi:hypothetical protein
MIRKLALVFGVLMVVFASLLGSVANADLAISDPIDEVSAGLGDLISNTCEPGSYPDCDACSGACRFVLGAIECKGRTIPLIKRCYCGCI